jgi:hypothetical protein
MPDSRPVQPVAASPAAAAVVAVEQGLGAIRHDRAMGSGSPRAGAS